MTLSGQSIRTRSVYKWYKPIQREDGTWNNTNYEYAPLERGLITPFHERTISPTGKSFGLSSAGYDIRVDKFNRNDFDDGRSVRLDYGDFILASSMERIIMPPNLQCIVHDKSSWAREGLAIQNTVLEPGWEGYITLELSFHRRGHHIVIHRGDPIAQLVFHQLDYEAEAPYNGKYQNQPAEPVESIKESMK